MTWQDTEAQVDELEAELRYRRKVSITIGVIAVALMSWLMPIAAIWSLNVLFDTGIPITLRTWAASLILTGFVVSGAWLRS